MFTALKVRKANRLTGIVSDDNGTAVVSIRNDGKNGAVLLEGKFEPITTDEKQMDVNVFKGISVETHTCTTLLSIGDYQLLVVDAPEVPPDELRAAVRWKIQDLIEYHVDDAVLDVFDAPPGGPAGTRKQMYVVVALSETIKKRITNLDKTDVKLNIIDIPELAMRNLASRLPEDQLGLVTLYFNQQQCLITVTHNATLYLTRTVEFKYGNVAEEPTNSIELSDRLALEIQRSVDYYEQHFHKAPIQTIAILTLPPSLTGLDIALQQLLGLTTRLVTLDDIITWENDLELESTATSLLAVGSALRSEIKAL